MELRLMLTAACNFRCSFCLNEYWPSTEKGRVLTADTYAELVSAAQLAISTRQVTLTGGEPTLCRDLGDIIATLSSLAIELTMVSNGYLLRQHVAALGGLNELHVSFHSWDDADWRRITNSRTTPADIADAIQVVRSAHPELPMKLNIVAGSGNSDPDSIQKYIEFARAYHLTLNVFRESTARTSALNGEVRREVASEWWNLSSMGAIVMERSVSRTTYLLDGAVINLASTSTDASRWTSMWISPNANAYVDILHRTPDLPLSPLLRSGNSDLLRLALLNLASEASVHRLLDSNPPSAGTMLDEIVSHRATLQRLTSAPPQSVGLQAQP